MSTLGNLLAEHTVLPGNAVDHLHAVVGEWQLLADLSFATRAVHGMEYVLHQAAIPSVPRSVNDPIASNRANVDASLNVLVAARDHVVPGVEVECGVLEGKSVMSAAANMQPEPDITQFHTDPRWQAVERILAGDRFCRSPRLCDFLRFVRDETLLGRAEFLHEQLIGVKSAEIAAKLGYTYGEEVIHRNDLVLL